MKLNLFDFLVLLSLLSASSGFNLDVDNFVKYRGRTGSMFGFTVAQHSYEKHKWIIVGAPEDQSDIQPTVSRGGAVYRCDLTTECKQVIFDRNGNNRDDTKSSIDSKSNQWFGATLTSSNGSILACAPRYVYTQQISREERRDPVGTCWLSRDQLDKAQEFSPCRNRDWGYHRHGHCQAGMGAALSKDGGRLYIGAPGSCFWQGSVHSVAATTNLPFQPNTVIIFQKGKTYSQNRHNRADLISSSEAPPIYDNSYLGYSMASGRFYGGLEDPFPSDIAVGVPRGERLNGKVVLFSYNMTLIRNITGEQLGAYFGYAMAACDLDADGYDDLIVGAPMYTEEGNHEMFYETGRIYVFYAGFEDDRQVREGDKNNRARFGHSIACLGDVNRDGYNDIAVGAPYAKDGEHGAVYIYHGSKTGLRGKYSQVLKAEDIPGNPLTFGFAVAGGVDMDQNLYPDLTVGAYESDQAFLFKARPVVDMISTVTYDSESKQISLGEKNCTLKDGVRVPCVKMDACLQYEGLGVEERLDFEIQLVLDARKPKSPRLAFLSQEGRNAINTTIRLDKGRKMCSSYWVYLKTNIKDKLTSLDAELWYSLTNQNRLSRSLPPVLNSNENLSAKDTISIQKNCGTDNICIPDLRLIASPSVEKYVLGSGKRLEIEVEVQNEGEDAFESTFELMVPSGLNYVKIERKDEFERDIPVQCSPPSFNNNYTLHCDIGNPLPKDKLVKFLVLLQPFYQKTMNATYNFTMSVNSTNPEKSRTVSDNLVHFGVPIWVVTELSISGSSRPVDVYYNSSQYVTDESVEITKESQIGPQVAHLYTITNRGPSEFLKAKATILWPSNTLNGEPLLYLLEPPETSGDIECHVEDDEYNVRKVKIERKGKSFFDSEFGETSAWTAEHEDSSSSSSGGGTYSKTSSSSSWSSSSSSGSQAHLSEEERLRFQEEERRREEEDAAGETGDGSLLHIERAKARVQGKNHYSRNGGKLESDSHSRGSESSVRERGRTEYSRVPDVNSRAYEEEMYSRHSSSSRTGGGNTGGAVVHTESREKTSVTTKGRGGGKTETTWREEKDGVVKSGSDVVHHGGAADDSSSFVPGGSAVERRTYEKNLTSTSSSRRGGGGGGSRTSWRVEGGGATREDGGTLIIDDGSAGTTSSRGRGQGRGSGSRTAEEKRSEWNTTWTSGGRPVTSEHTSWRKEQDGAVVGSGDHSRTYEGSYDSSAAAAGGSGASRTHGSAYDARTSSSSARHRGGASHDERVSSSSSSKTSSGAYDERTSGSGSRSSGSTGGFIWHVEGEGIRKEDTGAVATDDGTLEVTTSRRRGQGGTTGTKTAEERRSEWNTTWSSGGRPVTSEHTSWRKEQDGAVVGSGDRSRTYEGSYDSSAAAVGGSGASRTHGSAYDERTSSSSARHRGGASHDERVSSSSSSKTSSGGYDERTSGSGSRSSGSTGGFNWQMEGEGMRKEDTGAVATDDETLEVTASRRRGQGGTTGTKTAEERRSEWNTTWSSGGRPVTSEHTSWRKEQDGATIGSGEHSRTYEGTAAADRAKAELESRLKEQLDRRITSVTSSQGSSGAGIDENLIATGATGEKKTYKKEWEEHYNTTWGTSTDGKPVTVAKTKWTIQEDGKVKTGGDTRTFEGVAPGTDGTTINFPSHSGGRHRTEVTSQGQGGGSSRHHSSHHDSRTVHGGSESEADGSRAEISGTGLSESSRRTESRTVVSSHHGGSGHHFSTENEESGDVRGGSSRREGSERKTYGAGGTSGSRTSTSFHRNEGESEADFERRSHSRGSSSHNSEADSGLWLESERREGGSESRYAESGRRTQHGHRAGESHSGSERKAHSGSSSAASSVGESSGASAFDFGAIARGPGDGKARTYVTDLGILEKESSGGSERASESASGSRGAGHHGSSHHSRERHYSFGGEGGRARDEGSDSFSSSATRGAGSRGYSGEARYSSGSRTYSTGIRDIEGDPDLDPDYENRRAGSSSSSSSSWSKSYSSQGGSEHEPAVAGSSQHTISNADDRSGFRHYRRERRYVDDYDAYGYDEYEEDDSQKRCTGPVRCTRIVCKIGALKKDQEVHVAVRSRLWVATVKKIAPHVETVLGSEMVAKVTLLPTIGRPSSKTMTKNSTEIKTRIMAEPVTQPDVVPLWIVVLSAVSGALILMLLVYILYKLGFFKRNRPETASAGSEKTPLNRNGHYQGDEPL